MKDIYRKERRKGGSGTGGDREEANDGVGMKAV